MLHSTGFFARLFEATIIALGQIDERNADIPIHLDDKPIACTADFDAKAISIQVDFKDKDGNLTDIIGEPYSMLGDGTNVVNQLYATSVEAANYFAQSQVAYLSSNSGGSSGAEATIDLMQVATVRLSNNELDAVIPFEIDSNLRINVLDEIYKPYLVTGLG